ncbi:hypothetical protein [Leifsonia sp. NPDC058230]|uniref:hypothetical protein n=1 Tax=Leifsonia sp. NPDC058230 TaxID=3346391 RepID=UPI0036DE31CD
MITGEVLGKPDTSNPKGFQLQIRSKQSEPLAEAIKALKAGKFEVHSVTSDGLGATSSKYFVAVSVRDGVVNYSFASR